MTEQAMPQIRKMLKEKFPNWPEETLDDVEGVALEMYGYGIDSKTGGDWIGRLIGAAVAGEAMTRMSQGAREAVKEVLYGDGRKTRRERGARNG